MKADKLCESFESEMGLKIGELIRFEREGMGWTIKEFINRLDYDVSPTFISKLENRGAIPGVELLCKIAEVINYPPEKLLYLAKNEKLKKYEESLEKKYIIELNKFNFTNNFI